jgi:N-acetylmuramoyl-L-alanine amidase
MLLSIILVVNIFSISTIATPDPHKFYIEYDGQIYRYKDRFIKLVVDGQEIETGEMPAIIITEEIEGKKYPRTMVPVREVCESEVIGAKVKWIGKTQEVYITYEDKFIVLKINDRKAVVNNKEILLDVPPKIIKDVNKEHGKTMIPIRFVFETLGYEVNWHGKEGIAEMVKKNDNVENQNNNNDSSQNNNENNDNQGSNDNNNQDSNNNDEQVSNANNNESLDALDSQGAKRQLPTSLKNKPVVWMVADDVMASLNDKYTEATINRQLHPTTNIKSIEYEENDYSKKFIIKASSPITDVKESYYKNRFIVDIDNANHDMKDYEKTFDNSVVTGVRSSQFTEKPNKSTRLVFDLKSKGYKFKVSLSDDRKSIYVSVHNNALFGLNLGQNEKGDFIQLFGIREPDVKAFRLSNPDRIVFDLPNTDSLLNKLSSLADGQYVKEIRTAQFDELTTRVVVETDGQADFNITKDGHSATMIQLIEPSYDNIKYENFNNPTIILNKKGNSIDLKKIKYEDNYLKKEYIITLPGDYTQLFGSGGVKVNDGIIDSIDIKNDSKGNTQLIINESSIYEFRIAEDENNIYLKGFKPKELYSKVIVIDPGHGGKDPGAMDNGLDEKTVNLDITLYLKEYLDVDGSIKVYYTRLDDSYPTLGERAVLANEIDADFFLSIHNNWYTPRAKGTETFYMTGAGTKSIQMAKIFQKAIILAAGTYDRGHKDKNLFVLRNTKMPAVLVEIAFLSNTSDANKLKSEAFKKNVANGLYKAILETFRYYPTGR